MRALRIGLLIDNWHVPSWVASIIADIVTSDSSGIAAVVMNRSSDDRGRLPSPYCLQPNLFRLTQFYLYLDYRIFHPSPDALELVDLEEPLKEYPVIRTEPIFDGPYFRFSEGDQARLQELDIDVLLVFWTGLPGVHVGSLAQYGAWFFLDHERLLTGHAPVGFWEVLNQRPVTTQRLQAQLASSSEETILHSQSGPTDPRSISRSRNNLLWKSVPLASRKLDELHRSGSLDPFENGQQNVGDDVLSEAPSNLTIVKAIASNVSRFVRDRITNRRYIDQWVIAYKYATCEECGDRKLADYHWLIPPKDRFWADPFPVQTDDGDFLFFEECLYSENKGHLCVAAIDQNGLKEEPKTILTRDYHLSYPFVFLWHGERYLIPETQDANRIDVYKFDAFPYGLSYYKTIMNNVRACDATLFEADGSWWMFVAIGSHGTWNVDELFLYYADNPFGPWVAHPKNPIKSDVRSARPAGGLFARQGKYYRPAQDCSRGYGHAIRLQEVKVLSRTKYVEEEVETILPDWSIDIVATHTLNAAGALSVVDAKKRRRR